VSEVDVEELAVLLHHDVAGVPVADAHDVGGDQVAGAGPEVVLLGNGQLLPLLVLVLQVDRSGALVEGVHQSPRVVLVDLRVVLGVDDFDEADLGAGGQRAVDVHLEVQPVLAPQLVEHAEHLQHEAVLLEVVAVLEHDAVGLALVPLLRQAGQRERQFLRVVHLALLPFEGLEDVLRANGEVEAVGTELVELVLDCCQRALEALVLVLEVAELLRILDERLVHLDQVVVDAHLLGEFLAEGADHQQALQVLVEPAGRELLVDAVLELPEVLLPDAVGLVHALLQDQLDQRVGVRLETHQRLRDLVAVQHPLVVQQALHAPHCVVPHSLVCDGRSQQEKCFDGLQRLPLRESSVDVCELGRVGPVDGVKVVDQFVGLVAVILLAAAQQVLVPVLVAVDGQGVEAQQFIEPLEVVLLLVLAAGHDLRQVAEQSGAGQVGERPDDVVLVPGQLEGDSAGELALVDVLVDAADLEQLHPLQRVQLHILLPLHQEPVLVEQLQRPHPEGEPVALLREDVEAEHDGGLQRHPGEHAPGELLADGLAVVGEDELAVEGGEHPAADDELHGQVHHEGHDLHLVLALLAHEGQVAQHQRGQSALAAHVREHLLGLEAQELLPHYLVLVGRALQQGVHAADCQQLQLEGEEALARVDHAALDLHVPVLQLAAPLLQEVPDALLPQETRDLLRLQSPLLLHLQLDLLVGAHQFVRRVQLLDLDGGLGVLEVLVGGVPEEELEVGRGGGGGERGGGVGGVFVEEVVPGEAGELSAGEVVGVPVEDEALELFLVVDGDLHDFEVDGVAVVEGLADELEVDDGLVAVEVLVLVPHLEDQLVYRVLHRDHHAVVLQQHPVDRADHLVNAD
jgi:hypothetical protein